LFIIADVSNPISGNRIKYANADNTHPIQTAYIYLSLNLANVKHPIITKRGGQKEPDLPCRRPHPDQQKRQQVARKDRAPVEKETGRDAARLKLTIVPGRPMTPGAFAMLGLL
jgi:hypothetical protein